MDRPWSPLRARMRALTSALQSHGKEKNSMMAGGQPQWCRCNRQHEFERDLGQSGEWTLGEFWNNLEDVFWESSGAVWKMKFKAIWRLG